MKNIMHFFKNFRNDTKSNNVKIYREWDRQRSLAKSPSELAEIDAIFSRYV